MKKLIQRIGILLLVFAAATAGFGILLNRDNADLSADMGGATLPRISFVTEGYEVNAIPGYVEEMEIPSMRETITPVTGRKITAKLNAYEAKVESVSWKVLTLDGTQVLAQGEVETPGEEMAILLPADLLLGKERVLQLTLRADSKDVYYYTRIRSTDETNYKECFEFAVSLRENAFVNDDPDVLGYYLEPKTKATSYNHITINNTVTDVAWGKLYPRLASEILWEVTECNPAFVSLRASYRVICRGDTGTVYTVNEFFRVRKSADTMYLADYVRDMEQIFDGEDGTLDGSGIQLGIASEDCRFLQNEEGTIVSFVQGNELWNYDKAADELSLVFSFASAENQDARNYVDKHEIKILDVDAGGNTTFTVCGYMNRGSHEGQVGVSVCSFDAEKNAITEKAFIPSKKGSAVALRDVAKNVYYSNITDTLYVLMDGTIHKIDLAEDTRTILARGLSDSQYCISDDGFRVAYQQDAKERDKSQRITVLNMRDGVEFEVTAKGSDAICPIGFIRGDFVCGTLKSSDAGLSVSGAQISPYYKLDIWNENNENVKTYQVPDVFIISCEVNDNMLTVNRVVRGENSYQATTPDYIANHEAVASENISVGTYSDEVYGDLVRLNFAKGIVDTDPKILRPKQVMISQSNTIRFDEMSMADGYYVYVRGNLEQVVTDAAQAIALAESGGGVAVTERGSVICERGNTARAYEVDALSAFSAEEGESSMAACIRKIKEIDKVTTDLDIEKLLADGTAPLEVLREAVKGEAVDLTGSPLSYVKYFINRETPVITYIGDKAAVLIGGYNATKGTFVYYDPADGEKHVVWEGDMAWMCEQMGNVFFGYVE